MEDLSRLLAAGGPCEWPAGPQWPLHQAIAELGERLRAIGSDLAYATADKVPDPDLALAVVGVSDAFSNLALSGVVRSTGSGLTQTWTVDAGMLTDARRDLMRLRASEASLVAQAGRRWAALAETSAKNWRRPSSSSTVASGTRNRRHEMLSGS